MLGNTLSRLQNELSFLWKDYAFHLIYIASGYEAQPRGLLLGMGNKTLHLLFEMESSSPLEGVRCRIGTRYAWYAPPGGSYSASYDWYAFPGLLGWLEGEPYQAEKDMQTDWESLSQSLHLHMDQLLDLFKDPKEIGQKLKQPRRSGIVEVGDGYTQHDHSTLHGGTQ